jgi:hypothetical protein
MIYSVIAVLIRVDLITLPIALGDDISNNAKKILVGKYYETF